MSQLFKCQNVTKGVSDVYFKIGIVDATDSSWEIRIDFFKDSKYTIPIAWKQAGSEMCTFELIMSADISPMSPHYFSPVVGETGITITISGLTWQTTDTLVTIYTCKLHSGTPALNYLGYVYDTTHRYQLQISNPQSLPITKMSILSQNTMNSLYEGTYNSGLGHYYTRYKISQPQSEYLTIEFYRKDGGTLYLFENAVTLDSDTPIPIAIQGEIPPDPEMYNIVLKNMLAIPMEGYNYLGVKADIHPWDGTNPTYTIPYGETVAHQVTDGFAIFYPPSSSDYTVAIFDPNGSRIWHMLVPSTGRIGTIKDTVLLNNLHSLAAAGLVATIAFY